MSSTQPQPRHLPAVNMGDFDFTFKQMSAAMPVFSTETQRRRKRQALERKRKRDREAVVETAETGIRKEESEFDAADDAAVEHLPLETAESRTSDEADASVPLQLPRPLPREPENDEEEYVLHHLMKEEWKKVVADHMHLLLDENGNLVEWWFKVMADMRVQFWTEFYNYPNIRYVDSHLCLQEKTATLEDDHMKDLKLAAEKGYEKWYFEGVEYALRTTYPMDWTPDSAEFDEVVTRIERMDLPIDEKHEMMDGQLSKLVRENASEKEAIMDEMERLRVRLKEIEMEEKKIASVIVRLKEE